MFPDSNLYNHLYFDLFVAEVSETAVMYILNWNYNNKIF